MTPPTISSFDDLYQLLNSLSRFSSPDIKEAIQYISPFMKEITDHEKFNQFVIENQARFDAIDNQLKTTRQLTSIDEDQEKNILFTSLDLFHFILSYRKKYQPSFIVLLCCFAFLPNDNPKKIS